MTDDPKAEAETAVEELGFVSKNTAMEQQTPQSKARGVNQGSERPLGREAVTLVGAATCHRITKSVTPIVGLPAGSRKRLEPAQRPSLGGDSKVASDLSLEMLSASREQPHPRGSVEVGLNWGFIEQGLARIK